MGLAPLCLDQRTPSSYYMRGRLRLGVLHLYTCHHGTSTSLAAGDGVLGLLGCGQGGGLASELVSRPLQSTLPSCAGWGCSLATMVAGLGAMVSTGPSVPVPSVSEYPANSLCSLEAASCFHIVEKAVK